MGSQRAQYIQSNYEAVHSNMQRQLLSYAPQHYMHISRALNTPFNDTRNENKHENMFSTAVFKIPNTLEITKTTL
jgi:hypothetical protein